MGQQGEIGILEVLGGKLQEGSAGEQDVSPDAEPSSKPVDPTLPAHRIGVISGHSYGESVNQFIARHEGAEQLIEFKNAIALAESLDRGDIDVAFLDRVIQQMFLSAGFYRYEQLFKSEPLHQALAHVAFSRVTVPKEFMREVEQSLARIPDFFADHMTAVTVIEPWIINRALTSGWFLWLDIIGTVAFAMSGIVIAREERYSLVGAFVLSSLPAVGGGGVRDLLVDRHPIGILSTPLYLSVLIGVVLVAAALLGIHDRLVDRCPRYANLLQQSRTGRFGITSSFTLEVTDAIGLAAFTVTGVSIAFTYQAYPLWIWAPLLAVLTSSAGGILRDTIRSHQRIPALTTSLYAEISALCGLGMVLALLYTSDFSKVGPDVIIMATIITAFGLRMLVVVFDIKPFRL